MLNKLRETKRPLALTAFVALGGLLVYAFALRQGLGPSVAWFWLLVGVIDGAILLQILSVSDGADSRSDWLVLSQIVGLKVLLSLMVVWTASNGLFGFDPHFNLSATDAIGRWGWPVPDEAGLLKITHNYSLWPGLDVLTLTISEITGTSHVEVARYLPGAVGVLSVICLYLVGRTMFHSGRSGLLAALAMAQMFAIVFMHAWYIREAFAFPLLMALVAILVKGQLNARYRMVTIVLLGAMVLYHHLTSFMAVLLVATIALVYWAILSRKFAYFRAAYADPTSQRPEGRGTLAVLHATVFFAYAIYIGPLIIDVMTQAIQRVVVLGVGSSPFVDAVRNVQQQFVYYGTWAVTGIMWATLLAYLAYRCLVLKAGPRWSQSELPLFLWVVAVGLWVVASNYGGALTGADPTRLLAFGYPFALLLFAQVTLHSVASKGLMSRAIPALGTVTVAVFIAINLLGIPRYIYDAGAQPDYRSREVSLAYLPELYAANNWQATTIPQDVVLAGDWSTREIFGGLSQRQIAVDPDFFETGSDIEHNDGYVLRREMESLAYFYRGSEEFRFFPLDDAKLTKLLRDPKYTIVYDNGDTRLAISAPRGAQE